MNLYIFYLLDRDPDPHLSMRIQIREAFLNADPCGSGFVTLDTGNFKKKYKILVIGLVTILVFIYIFQYLCILLISIVQ